MEFYTIPPRLRNQRRHHQCSRRSTSIHPPPSSTPQPTTTDTSFSSVPQSTAIDTSSSTVPQPTAIPVQKAIEINEVWASNLIPEFQKIHWAISNGYNCVALDTEFPGCLYVPDGIDIDFRKRSCEDHYSVMKLNVDRLKIIQVGITLMDMYGNLPHFGSGKRVVWEFNLSDFDINRDECSKDSVELLAKQGLNFQRHKEFGISSTVFIRLMMISGVIGRSAAWITFQGGIDLAYLLKMMIGGKPLPNNVELFTAWIKYFFGPMVFDVKHMMKHCHGLYGGLNKVAETLKVERDAGESHRAGSDSLLTAMIFHKISQIYFPAGEGQRYAGQLHNLVV